MKLVATFNTSMTMGLFLMLMLLGACQEKPKPPPLIIGTVNSLSGSTLGGQQVLITGSGLDHVESVTFGGANCTGINITSSSSLFCTTPAHAAGVVTITAVNSINESSSLSNVYTYLSPPVVTTVTPALGPSGGGILVSVNGTGFQTGASVTFGGTPCTAVVVVSPILITCTTPTRPGGLVAATVANPDNQTAYRFGAFNFISGPIVTTVTPNGGPLAGGTAVSVNGYGFQAGAAVTFNGLPCTGIVVVSSNSITCTTPANAAGTVSVVVTNTDTQTGNSTAYTYEPGPTVLSISPTAGALVGGTLVTVTGTDFVIGAQVTIGGIACLSPTVLTPITITCFTPAHVAGLVSIGVTNPDTQIGSLAASYTFQPAPTVSSVSPNGGTVAGGTAVTVTGTNFITGATVSLGGSACAGVVFVNPTSLTCTTPAHAAGAILASVTNPDLQVGNLSAGFTYRVPPTVTTVAPTAGALAGGTSITITGTGFVAGATVDFGGSACASVNVVSATSITCTTAVHVAGSVALTVTNTDLQAVVAPAAFAYQPAPTVTLVAPAFGNAAGGTGVTITGTGFVTGATVSLGGTACGSVVVVNPTTITCTTVAHAAGVVTATVTNLDTQNGSMASAFTFNAAPTVASVAPAAGALAGATSITITGTGFLAGAAVTLGGSACTGITVVGPTTITCTTPVHAAGAVTVAVTNTDSQIGSTASLYTYQAAPTVASAAPVAGALAGATAVTITGTGFLTGATVDFGGSACTGVTVVNATTITCTTSAHVAGAVTIAVTNADAQTGNVAAAYTYQAAPTVTLVAAASGFAAGGTAVTLTGTGFLPGATVSFGGAACTAVVVVGLTSITCTTPAHVSGVVATTVTNTDTQAGTMAAAFTYLPAPVVTSVSPNVGPLAGATAITITGTGFVAAATVDVGGVACTGVTIVSATTITCTTGAHVAGLASVDVTNPDTQVGSASIFTYQPAPTVTSVLQAVGSIAGGNSVTVTGTGFLTGASVDFGGSACASVVVTNSTTITCTTLAHAAGAVTVTVTNSDTQNGNAAAAFTYAVAPAVSGVSPSFGPLAGGVLVTVSGSNFFAGATVSIGSNCAGVTVVNPTTITCTTSAHAAGPVTASVTNADSQSGSLATAYTYQIAPTVTTILPTAGALAGGTLVAISGTNFSPGITVNFSGSACTGVTVISSSALTCTSPAHAVGAVNVTVVTIDTQSGSLPSGYTYQVAPTVASVAPYGGSLAGGTNVTVTGTNFVSGASVTLGGAGCSSVVVVNPTTITCVSSAHVAGTVTAAVTNADGQSGSVGAAYLYQAAPTVTSISPSGGPLAGGTTVTITGTGFLTNQSVTFGGSACSSITVISPTSITCDVPAHAAGSVTVTVTNDDNQSGSSSGYTYRPLPTVTSVSPNAGPLAGGRLVTVSGAGFVTGAVVKFAAANCTGVTVTSSTTITCTTPANVAGPVTVSVTNTDTQMGFVGAAYTYQNAPTVTSVAPSFGPLGGGQAVTVTGTGFIAGATVKFGSNNCTGVLVTSATTITCTTPSQIIYGGITVTVTNADAQAANLAVGYIYARPPTITSLDFVDGPLAGGRVVTITGTGILTGATVNIAGAPCPGVVVLSATSIRCTTAAHIAGATDVYITNADNQNSNTLVGGFTYLAAPTISAVSPATGTPNGGTQVTLTGTGFRSLSTVDFGGSACTPVTFISSTSMTCITTAHAAGMITATVTTPEVQSGNMVTAFNYVSNAQLRWSVGVASPTPPDPDSYGTTTTNITHTFTLVNVGDITSTVISLSISGSNPGAWLKGTDSCTGATLTTVQSCTVQYTFLGGMIGSGSYSGVINAAATTGGSTTNSVTGIVP